MYSDVTVAGVEGSGRRCADENPGDFVKKILGFVEKFQYVAKRNCIINITDPGFRGLGA